MKRQYSEFLESHRNITMCCKDIASDMASFYLVFSAIEGNGNTDQRKFLNEKMARIGDTLNRLAVELKAQQAQLDACSAGGKA